MSGDPMKVAVAVAARVDGLEVTVESHTRDLKATRDELESHTRSIAGVVKKLGEKPKGDPQLDWLRVDDPDTAMELINYATRWADRFLTDLEAPMTTCFPWHPVLMVEVIALANQYRASWEKGPGAVSEFMARWLPTFRDRARGYRGDCNAHEHHTSQGAKYRAQRELLPDYAHWWATDRRGDPPGLTRI
jgi:hypothetical protein